MHNDVDCMFMPAKLFVLIERNAEEDGRKLVSQGPFLNVLCLYKCIAMYRAYIAAASNN